MPRSDAGAAAYLDVLPRLGAAGLEPWAAAYARVHAARIAWDIDYLNRTQRPVRCLNVGGAPYLFELLMRQARPDLEITTLDLEPDRFPGVEPVLGVRLVGLDVETASADALKALGRFDCIVLTEVFEHLRIDLLGTMSRLGALLTDDGVLYLSTPNGASLAAWRKAYLKGRTGPRPVDAWGRLQTLGHMGHVREYAMIEVQEVLAGAPDDGAGEYGASESHTVLIAVDATAPSVNPIANFTWTQRGGASCWSGPCRRRGLER